MIGAALLAFGTLTAGIQFGWQPLDGGGTEYIVQVEPQLLDSFRKNGFTSEIPPQRDIRRIRIVVGDAAIKNQGQMPPPATLPDAASAQPLHGGVAAETPKTPATSGVEKAGATVASGSETPAAAATAAHSASSADTTAAASVPAARPWMALLAVAGGLVVSLAGNVYLGWSNWTTRSRYLGLVQKMRGKETA